MGKTDLLAVRSDKEECVVTHQDIPSDSNFRRPGFQNKDADASNYVQQGYRNLSCIIKWIVPSSLHKGSHRNPTARAFEISCCVWLASGAIDPIYAQVDLCVFEVVSRQHGLGRA